MRSTLKTSSFLIGMAVVTACSGSGGGADVKTDAAGALPDFAEGTRLKALAYVLDDGQQLWHGWRDSARGETCSFQLAADGQLRCLPAFEAAWLFKDDHCTEPVLTHEPCVNGRPAAPPPYAAVGGTCGGNAGLLYKRLDRIGGQGSIPVYAFDSSGNCGQVGGAANEETWALAQTPEATDAFVSAREILEERGPDLAARYYRADDGALQLVGAYDRAAERPCAESTSMPGVCAPDPLITAFNAPVLTTGEYADAACTVATVLAHDRCDMPAPPTEIVFVPGGVPAPAACENGPAGRFFNLGAAVTARPFVKSGASCAQTTSNKVGVPSPFRFELADEVPTSTLPAVRTTDVGSGRLRVRTEETLDGRHLARTAIFDTAQGTTCTPIADGDTLRCLSDATAFFLDYADPECTQPVLEPFAYTRPPGGDPCGLEFLQMQGGASACGEEPPRPRYFELGTVMTLPTVFAKGTDGACVAQTYGPGDVRQLIEHPLSDAPAIDGD
jgi:hypothetical protein